MRQKLFTNRCIKLLTWGRGMRKNKIICVHLLWMVKIQQTKMLVTCQRFGDLFLFWMVWQYYTNQNQYNKGRFKVKATYVLAAVI